MRALIIITNDMTGATLSQAGAGSLHLNGTNSFTNTSVTGGTLLNVGNLTATLHQQRGLHQLGYDDG